MSIAKQLHELQETDNEVEIADKAVRHIQRQIDESEELNAVRTKLAAARQHREELSKRQRSLETDIGVLDTRLKKIEEELFSGRVRNQKELGGLQKEDESLKSQRSKLESQELAVMDQLEQTGKDVKIAEVEFQAVSAGWEKEKIKLTAELEKAKSVLAEVTQRRRQQAAVIEKPVLTVYEDVRRTRGKAVVPVDKGVCTGCRISPSVTDLHKVRSGQLVRCGSCGRILYLK